MKVVWLSWKDKKHPLAGGAELVTENILKRLVKDGHEVVLVTSMAEGLPPEETVNGYKIIRKGSRYTVHWHTLHYYRKHLRGWADLVIDEVNTAPFFARHYTKAPTVTFIHQLARQVWFYEMPWPLSWIGYIAEPIYLRLLSKSTVITVSESTKQDLVSCGFKARNIHIIREGITVNRLTKLADNKYKDPTLLAFGAVRPMKRTLEAVKAFEVARALVPNLKLSIAGSVSDSYAQKVVTHVETSPYKQDITIHGRVTDAEKEKLMERAHLQVVTSIKEGWGLTVTEANSQGTPAAAYDVDGLRDSVKQNKTGVITPVDHEALGKAVAELLQDKKRYADMREAAWKDSAQYTFDATYKDFLAVIERLPKA